MPSYKYLPDKSSTENLYFALFGELPAHDIDPVDLPDLHVILGTLTEREENVIIRYFGISRNVASDFKELLYSGEIRENDVLFFETPRETYAKIAKSYGISKSAISNSGKKALKKLRHPSRAKMIQKLFMSRAELRIWVASLSDEVTSLHGQISRLKGELALERMKYEELVKQKETLSESDFDVLKISEFNFSARTINCLLRHGIQTLDDLIAMSRYEVFMIRNMGRKSLEEVELLLEEIGLSLRNDGRKVR